LPGRRFQGVTPIRLLLVVAFLEIAINRVAIGSKTPGYEGLLAALIPLDGDPPAWHALLSYVGLFLFYFTGTLAAGLVALRCVDVLRSATTLSRDSAAAGALAVAGLLAAVQLVVSVPELSVPLEIALAVAVGAHLAATYGRDRDLGVQIGMVAIAGPLLVHAVSALGAKFLWREGVMDGPGASVARVGLVALCIAALASPYCLAPRPFARAVTRPVPVLFAMAIAAAGAVAARGWYSQVAHASKLAIGIELENSQGDPRLALYLLAIATLAWTLASCMIAASEARRQIGAGLAFVVFGGYAFLSPDHYLLVLVGLSLIADASRRVRDEEIAAMTFAAETPPIPDAAWASYVTAVTTSLRRTLRDVHGVTARGEANTTSSIFVGERDGLVVRVRLERIDTRVVAIDVVLGREIDEQHGATLALWAIPRRGRGPNPSAPPAAPAFKTGDATFDQHFKSRGSEPALRKLLDDGLRARAVAALDGWLAYWDAEGLRYRVYPGRGAPLDHPIPLSELQFGRAASPERLVAVVELLAEIAARGVTIEKKSEPVELKETSAGQ
jgi:hypothetical protein